MITEPAGMVLGQIVFEEPTPNYSQVRTSMYAYTCACACACAYMHMCLFNEWGSRLITARWG